MQEAPCGLALELIARYTLDGFGAPIGAHIGEHLGPPCQQEAEEHGDPVQCVILGGHDIGLPNAVPVEGGVKDRLHEITVGEMIRPLPLSLEAGRQRIVPQRLLAIAQLSQARVAHHQVPSNQRHLDRQLPVTLLLLTGPLLVWRVTIHTLLTVLTHPGPCPLKLLRIIDILLKAAHELAHVDVLDPHPQVAFEQVWVDNRPGDAHRDPAHRKIGLATHVGYRQASAGKAQQLLLHVRGNRIVICILHIAAIDAEGR